MGMAYTYIDKKCGTYWRFDYVLPISKKRATLSIGVYLEITLAMARKYRDEYCQMLADNRDPSVERKLEQDQAKNALANTKKQSTSYLKIAQTQISGWQNELMHSELIKKN
jgi:hypothetical protein